MKCCLEWNFAHMARNKGGESQADGVDDWDLLYPFIEEIVVKVLITVQLLYLF